MTHLRVEGQPSAFRSTSSGLEATIKLGSILAYQINWNEWLCDCDEIQQYDFESVLPITDKQITDDVITFKLEGTVVGRYPVSCTIRTFEGLRETITVFWNVV